MSNEIVRGFELFPLYASIDVQDHTLADAFNDWRSEHVRQGFSWRSGSVSFGTLDTLPMSVSIYTSKTLRLREDTIRAIRVPFAVTARSDLCVAVVTEHRGIRVAPGEYALVFEHGMCKSGDKMWCTFTFVPDPAAEPAILIADPELSKPPDPLLMEADPA